SVAQVNQRRGESTLAEERAPLDARFGPDLAEDEPALGARERRARRRGGAALKNLESGGGPAERARDEDLVAGARAGTEHGATALHLAQHDRVDHDASGRARDVAADDRD